MSELHAQAQWGITHVIVGCDARPIEQGESLVIPGSFCVFDDDGTAYSASWEGLRAIGKDNAVLWEKPGLFHHHLSFNTNRDKLLALEAKPVPGMDKWIQDAFVIYSKSGEVLFEQTTSHLLKSTRVHILNWPVTTPPLIAKGFEKESSHFNSFYEIPPLKKGVKVPEWMRAGNYIVNSVGIGFFVLSPDLKTVVFHDKIPHADFHRIHDLQALPDGTLLYFNNVGIDAPVVGRYSTVERAEPKKYRILDRFDVTPKGAFFSNIGGTVQDLDGEHWLISHFLTGYYVYSKKSKKLVLNRSYYEKSKQVDVVLQIRGQDLTKFFNSRK